MQNHTFSAVSSVTRRLELGRLARLALLVCATAAAVLNAPHTLAQNAWPNKPVRIIVPFAPGGTTDILARAIAPELSKAFGQSFVVENRAGAGGNLGADAVAKSAADGYTLLMGTVGTHGINKALYPSLSYNPVKDFAPITLVADVPNVMVMNTGLAQKLGINSVADFVKYAKANRQAQHGLQRQRHIHSFGRRAVQKYERHLHGSLSVPRLRPRATRLGGRHNGCDV
jgi:tripartite-type tricarboxylate transporter receptor subunit TctC